MGKIDSGLKARAIRDYLVQTLQGRWGLTGSCKPIVAERLISPADFQRLYNANAGSIYGIGSNSRLTAFVRPPNRDAHIKGLFFAGRDTSRRRLAAGGGCQENRCRTGVGGLKNCLGTRNDCNRCIARFAGFTLDVADAQPIAAVLASTLLIRRRHCRSLLTNRKSASLFLHNEALMLPNTVPSICQQDFRPIK